MRKSFPDFSILLNLASLVVVVEAANYGLTGIGRHLGLDRDPNQIKRSKVGNGKGESRDAAAMWGRRNRAAADVEVSKANCGATELTRLGSKEV